MRLITVTLITVAFAFLAIAPTASYGQLSGSVQYSRLKAKPKLLFDQWAARQKGIDSRSLKPAQRFATLPISRRSTFAAATNALLFTKLTDQKGRSLGTAIDLIESIDSIAGQENGKGSDEQFRLYVTLKPHAIQTLESSKEFEHGKDNTIFHKGFPINYRQGGKPPTMQFSIATDGVKADIDVDYRASSFPKALFNGHLSASNSDVRARPNYDTHLKRWPGLIDWWDSVIANFIAEFKAKDDKGIPEQLIPASGHEHAPDAVVVADTAYDFLRTWLVDRNLERADAYLGNRLIFCSDLKDPKEKSLLDEAERLLFYETLKMANKELKKPKELVQVIRPVVPVDPFIKAIDHRYKQSFTLAVIPDNDYNHFVCVSKTSETTSRSGDRLRTYGKYYVTKFQFKLENGQGGILRLLWTKVDGAWKIEAFDAVTA